MKKAILSLVVITAIILAGCQKDMPKVTEDEQQEISFNIGQAEKGLKDDYMDCSLDADYALIVLNDDYENPVAVPVFYVNEVMYTQAIKMTPGSYTLNEFILYQEAGNPDILEDDLILSATPHSDSEYAQYVDNPLSFTFTVDAFTKKEIPISILCYEPQNYEAFGFSWFRIDYTHLEEGLFFGDYCTEDFIDFTGSAYGDYPKFDMPAIYIIDLYLDQDESGDFTQDELIASYNNNEDENGDPLYSSDANMATIPPLSVLYTNNPDVTENYKLVVKVLMKNPSGSPEYDYIESAEWFFTDDMSTLSNADGSETFGPGNDGVYDFIVGPCQVIDFDIEIDEPDDPGDPDGICNECLGGVTSMTLLYAGDQTAYVTIQDDIKTYFAGDVNPGEEITAIGTKDDGKFEKNDIDIMVDGQLNAEVHVSCSKPFYPGLVLGDFLITAGTSKDGGEICPISDNDCSDCAGGVISLTLKYEGMDAAQVIVKDSDQNQYFNSLVDPGEEFTFIGNQSDGKFAKNDIYVFVDGVENTKLHVSCSKPVNPGLTFGDFLITNAISKDGGVICPFVPDDHQLPNAETAFAFYDVTGTECFPEMVELNNARWGWTNKISGNQDTRVKFPIYAGAAQCDITKGIEVGELQVDVEWGKVKEVKFVMFSGYKLFEAHVYIGSEKLPRNSHGDFTVAPGQYPMAAEGLDEESSVTFPDDVQVGTGDFYLIAHAVVK